MCDQCARHETIIAAERRLSYDDWKAILAGQFAYEDVFRAFMQLPPAEARQGFEMLDLVFSADEHRSASVEIVDREEGHRIFKLYRFIRLEDAQLVTIEDGRDPPLIVDFSLSPQRSSRPKMPIFGNYLSFFYSSR